MGRLVALDLAGGPRFVEAVRRAFDAGDAVWPVDQRLRGHARSRAFDAIRPTTILTEDEERSVDGGEPVEDGDALVIATSGTTGDPRGVILEMEALRASAVATSARLLVDPKKDHWLSCLPLSHIGGFSVVSRALITGTALTVQARFEVEPVKAASRAGATLVSLVPTALLRLDASTTAAFRMVVLGGSAPPSLLPKNVVTTYGLSETASGVVYDGVPLDGVELHIGLDGEILVRAPMLARAYRDGAAVTDADGWLATGDCGSIDEDGHLRIDGRLNERIVSGGENIWPSAVEEAISRHPGVKEVGVIGVADPEWGERVVAVVVPTAAGLPKLAALRALVGDELGPFASPRELVLASSLPRTTIGKLRRAALARLVDETTRS